MKKFIGGGVIISKDSIKGSPQNGVGIKKTAQLVMTSLQVNQ
jgi:hypothetical protein